MAHHDRLALQACLSYRQSEVVAGHGVFTKMDDIENFHFEVGSLWIFGPALAAAPLEKGLPRAADRIVANRNGSRRLRTFSKLLPSVV